MYCRDRTTLVYRVVSRAMLLSMLGFWLFSLPGAISAQTFSDNRYLNVPPAALDGDEALPLTPGQEKARQLATAFKGKPLPEDVATPSTTLGVITAPSRSFGRRLVIPLFTTRVLEARLVGGQPTFASPGDSDETTVAHDAKRLLFIPASQATMAMEVLVK